MKGYVTALHLPLLLGLLGVAGVASATTVTLDFNDSKNTTANTQLLAGAPNGAVKNVTVGGRNAVQTGGTAENQFLYIAVPKGTFPASKPIYAVVEYYDQGGSADPEGPADTFQLHYDAAGTDMDVNQDPIAKHDTKQWVTRSYSLPGADLQQMGPGGADIWIDDIADGPEIISKIVITDEDPTLTHWRHVDPANPIKIDGVISPGEWDNAYSVTLNSVAQDAYKGANWTGPDDYSGTYYYKWDENGVYIRGDVTDSTPRYNDATGDLAWKGDGVQIYLGLDWSDPSHAAYLDGTDFNIYIGLGETPQWGLESGSAHTVVDWGEIPKENVFVKTIDTPKKGYQFELFIPFSKLLDAEGNTKTKVVAGQKIGWFMFGNASKTLPGSNQEVAMSPFSRTRPSSTPSSWSTVVLEPTP